MASSSQRQKKRNAQMKRKKYDHKHQASGRSSHGKNEVVPEDETQSKDTERVVISQPKEETKELEPQDVVVQDLYDMPTESNDVAMEELEGQLSQLLSSRLPSHQPLPPMQEDISDSQSQMESYAPSINLLGLVSCLASLPMHRKLFIEKDLVELYEKRRPDHENDIMPPAPPIRPPAHSHPTQPEIIKLNKQPSLGPPPSSRIPEERSVLDTELNDLLQRDTASLLKEDSTKEKTAVKEKNEPIHQNTELDTALDELLDM